MGLGCQHVSRTVVCTRGKLGDCTLDRSEFSGVSNTSASQRICMARATNCEGSSHPHSFWPNSIPHRTLITCIWLYLLPSLSHKRTTQRRSPFATWTPTTNHLRIQSLQLN